MGIVTDLRMETSMDTAEEPNGLLFKINDRFHALYAVKLAGFPLFLMFFSCLIGAAFNTGHFVAYVIFALVFLVIAIDLRREKVRLLPVAAVVLCVNLALTILFAWSWANLSLLSLLIQGVSLCMVVQGLRGWWWLRKNPIELGQAVKEVF